jgi:hypothetical protein
MMKKYQSPDLPDTSSWLPRQNNVNALKNTFLQTCRSIEGRLIAESNIEKSFNIDNYDSGPGVEDLCRSQLQLLMPDRYTILSGIIIDQQGHTCGDCDVVVANRTWFPLVKYGAIESSRRVHIPVEAVYSVIEVKQTLTKDSLDDAMKKIVMYKRLFRKRSEYGRITENHNIESFDRPDNSLNYRFDSILAINCNRDYIDALIQRFFTINSTLNPSERINSLCILGAGYMCYVMRKEKELNEHLYPEYDSDNAIPFFLESTTDSFYRLWINLHHHLSLTVLNLTGFKYAYGADSFKKGRIIKI